jgi:transcriptional regulator with XRE-family HTH domain
MDSSRSTIARCGSDIISVIIIDMDASRTLRDARHRAMLSQRGLSAATGILQPAIARIESGDVIPRFDTLDRLLRGCGLELALASRPGAGLDRTAIRALLRLTPLQRIRLATREARNLDRLERGRPG